jgi:two-component system, cell cycle sensor histidine kinase and response regulator CckA
MQDEKKTKKQLIEELDAARQCVAESKNIQEEINKIKTNQEKVAKAFLQKSMYQNLHQGMMDAFATVDMEGYIKDYNDPYLSMLGYAPEEISKLKYEDITPQKWHMIEAAIVEKQVLTKGYSDIYEKEYRRKDGTVFPVELRTTLLRDNEGNPVSMWAIVRDISERKQLAELLEKSEEKLRLITENIMDCIALLDINGTYQYVTPSHRNTLGYDPEDMIGISGFSLTHPDDLERITKLYMDVIEHGWSETIFEASLRHKDGHYVPMEIRARTLNNSQGEIVGGIFAGRDITARRRMEEELLRAQKLESLGVLAGGIAHDFNNLMMVVQGNIELALIDLPPDHISHERLQEAKLAVEQTTDLTNRLITFSRGGDPHRELNDVTKIIRDAVHKIVKGNEVGVTFDFRENLYPIEVDELQIKQCFCNLLWNAIEAMPNGGNLTIRVENAQLTAQEACGLKEGCYLKITFTDDGSGIPEKHISKVFDPYFTTKKLAPQNGLGLGLAVCYSVLKKHGGKVEVKSQPGKSTSFFLYLPAKVVQAKEKAIKKDKLIGNVRVLIMDDNSDIREVERACLERLGHEVTGVKDGQEAIDTYKKAIACGAFFDLVILDLTVHQGLGGQQAMEELLKIDPAVRAIIASGYVDDPVIGNYTDYGFRGALKKPFKVEEMDNIVKRILLE